MSLRAAKSQTDVLRGTDYRLLDVIGEGTTSRVFRAVHRDDGHEVIVKLMRYRKEVAPQLADRMRLEAEAVASLNHRNLLRVNDYGVSRGRFYIVMQGLIGHTLLEELEVRKELSPEECAFLTGEVAAALSYVHDKGMVHRDVKPSNILLYEEGGRRGVKLFDFGILKLLDAASGRGVEPLAHPTDKGTPLGTPRYASPEQVLGAEVDARSDVYSLAAVSYRILCGRDPFAHHQRTAQLYKAHVRETPKPPSHWAQQPLPEALDRAVMRGLEKEAAKRPKSALAFAEALRAAAAGTRVTKARTVVGWHPSHDVQEAIANAKAKRLARVRTRSYEEVPLSARTSREMPTDPAPDSSERPALAAEAFPRGPSDDVRDVYPQALHSREIPTDPPPRESPASAAADVEKPPPSQPKATEKRVSSSHASPTEAVVREEWPPDPEPLADEAAAPSAERSSQRGALPNWYARGVQASRRASGRGTLKLGDELDDAGGIRVDDEIHIPMQGDLVVRWFLLALVGFALLTFGLLMGLRALGVLG